MPHHDCPDKEPALRLDTIEASGRSRVPFTTGVLVGIGETARELVDSLFVLADVHQRWGNIQEIIVQNFRAKADTPKRRDAEPTVQYFARVVAVARWIFGAEMNLQVGVLQVVERRAAQGDDAAARAAIRLAWQRRAERPIFSWLLTPTSCFPIRRIC